MTNQPNNAPMCCGQQAKWVEQTPSLAYFYCPTCKTEPKAPAKAEASFSLSAWSEQFKAVDGGATSPFSAVGGIAPPSTPGLYSPPVPAPPATQTWRAGDVARYLKSIVDGYRDVTLLSGPTLMGEWLVKRVDDGLELWLFETDLVPAKSPPPSPAPPTGVKHSPLAAFNVMQRVCDIFGVKGTVQSVDHMTGEIYVLWDDGHKSGEQYYRLTLLP